MINFIAFSFSQNSSAINSTFFNAIEKYSFMNTFIYKDGINCLTLCKIAYK